MKQKKILKTRAQKYVHNGFEHELANLFGENACAPKDQLRLCSEIESLNYEILVLSNEQDKCIGTIAELTKLHRCNIFKIEEAIRELLDILKIIKATPEEHHRNDLMKNALLRHLKNLNNLLLDTENQLSLLDLPTKTDD